MVSIHTLHELEASSKEFSRSFLRAICCFHSYASRIGSKKGQYPYVEAIPEVFPFIRFANWKQALFIGVDRLASWLWFPFIRFANWKQDFKLPLGSFSSVEPKFPFIRFANWKQGMEVIETQSITITVSIHTLRELEARRAASKMFL